MKVYNGLSLFDQKSMVENLFIWDEENGDKPCREKFKEWVLVFFTNKNAIREYMDDLLYDIQLSCDDEFFAKHNEGYKRQIEFLHKLL